MNTNRAIILGLMGTVAALYLSSCETPEGEGGSASISGVLQTQYYNDDYSQLLFTDVTADDEVFIIYGTEPSVGDKTTTLYDGSFQFQNLRKGDYTLFVYSDDIADAQSDTKIASKQAVHVDKNRQEVNLGTITRIKKLAWNDGKAQIKGKVELINYYNFTQWPNLVAKDTSAAQEYDVYLTYGSHTVYDERIRTHFDGSFVFKKLIPGTYDLFLYSDDVTGGTERVVLHHSVEISTRDQEVDLGTITVEQL